MAEYKKGDWVRVVDNAGAPRFYRVGEICKVSSVSMSGLVSCVGKDANMYEYRFEPWQPKVGERVRVKESANSQWAGEGSLEERHGSCFILRMKTGINTGARGDFYLNEIEPITDTLPVAEQPAARENAGGGFKAGDKIELVKRALAGIRAIGDVYEAVAHKKPADSRSVCFIGNDGEVTWAPGDFFKLHEPLTIQAGRFYKTRDGRKVGPMETSEWGGYRDRSRSVTSQCWGEAGTYIEGCTSNLDLIAEWVDTPVDTPVRDITAATVDAINDEYGPVAGEVPVAAQQARFKVGDVAEVVRCRPGMTSQIGKQITIARVSGERLYAPCSGCEEMIFYADELEHAAPATPTTAIVALIKDDQPLPADRPVVHTSAEAADAEARRLAGIHKGQEFGVFVLTGATHKEAKVYEHEWQRLAAEGQRADAEKELRRITGMSHSLARHVVSNRAA